MLWLLLVRNSPGESSKMLFAEFLPIQAILLQAAKKLLVFAGFYTR